MSKPETLPNVRRLNRALEASWRSGLVPPPTLTSEALEEAALGGRPKEAFGPDQSWREPFNILIDTLHTEADLNPLGKTMAHGQIVMALRARIRSNALWRHYPEILDRPFHPPIIILGQMRSGTTRMQRLLACDDRLTHTRLFESLLPVPQFARRVRAQVGLTLLRSLNPAIRRIHPTAATAPEEEFGLFSYSFGSAQFEAQWRIPGFSRWWETAPRATMYEEFKRLLKTIDWSRRNQGAGRWVIKAPQFLQDLPTVLDAFPGASLLCLERDPAQVIASSASLVWNQMRIQSDGADPHWVGREWLRKTRLRQEMSETPLRIRNVPRLRIDYEAMNRDWRSQMRRVYDFLGLGLTPDILRRMERYQSGARAHRGHVYDLGRFGLTENQVRAAFPEPSLSPTVHEAISRQC